MFNDLYDLIVSTAFILVVFIAYGIAFFVTSPTVFGWLTLTVIVGLVVFLLS